VYGTSEDELGPDPLVRHTYGLLGEMAFAVYYDLTINSETEWTDPGYDFLVSLNDERTKVDVKTIQRSDYNLIVEEGDVRADVYVLAYAESLDSLEVNLIGSATAQTVRNNPTKHFGQSNTVNHLVQQGDLTELPRPEAIQPFR
jgi:hypothetical protein